MSKLTYEDRIDIYTKRKQGISAINLSKEYKIKVDKINYLIRLIDKHGYDIIRITKNRTFTKYEKERIITRVLLDGESVSSVSIDEGLILHSDQG